jgi:hypothetical protein
MHDEVDDFEPVVSRLRSVGRQPLDHAVEQRVLARARRSRPSWWQSTKVKVAAGIAGGFMIGSVSLASAGALPDQAQSVAHSALGAIGVHVPPGKDRYNGPECGDVANHGEYVDAHPDDPAAGRSPCGKPMRSVNHQKGTGTDPAGTPGNSGGHGRPPWAGQGKGKEKNKDKDKEQDEADKPETDEPTNPADPTTTAPAVVAEPTTTAAESETSTTVEPTTTTSDSATSTTTESTSTTTAP